MLIAIGTGRGLQEEIKAKISSFNGHISIANFDNNNSSDSVQPISITDINLEQFGGIEYVNNVAYLTGVIKTKTSFQGVVLKGIQKNYQWGNFPEYITKGELPEFDDKTSREVLMSEQIAQKFNLQVGDRFQLYFLSTGPIPTRRVLKIAGLYSTGFPDFDETYVIGDLRHIQKLNKWQPDEIGNVEIVLQNFDEIDSKTEELYQNTSATLDVVNIKEQFGDIFSWISLFDLNIAIIIIIMIIVGGINMITALLVLILERTHMIGVLRVLGSSKKSIQSIFIIQASYLIGMGLFWGNFIGLGLLFFQQKTNIITLDPATYYVTAVPVNISFFHIIGLNGGTLIACLLMLIIPSFIISKIPPVQVLRLD